MINVEFKLVGEDILIDVSFKVLPSSVLGLYDGSILVVEGVVDEEMKKVMFTVGFSYDNKVLTIKEKDTQTILTHMKIHCGTEMTNHTFMEKVVKDDWSKGEPFYEVDVVKPPPTVMPPPEKDSTIYIDTVEELHNFIHNGDYDRGFNEGFLIGKSL